MPAPKPADMEECTPKLRCTQGEYVGVAYDPADPCEEGQTFNVETCSCDPFEFCDCSCDNDCGECEICDEATGTCAPDSETPECNPVGYVYNTQTARGLCVANQHGGDQVVCPGSAVEETWNIFMYKREEDDPAVSVYYETNTTWTIESDMDCINSGSCNGYMQLGDSLTAVLPSNLGASSSNYGWQSPGGIFIKHNDTCGSVPNVVGYNCGAARMSDNSDYTFSVMTINIWPGPADPSVCDGLSDKECCKQHGPCDG